MIASRLRTALLALALAGAAGDVAASSLSGSYLAGRAAAARDDYSKAADYFSSALARDPSNPALRDQALTFRMLAGDLRGAAAVAEAMLREQPGHQLAALAAVADAMRQAEFDRALERLDAPESGLNRLVSALFRGWAEVGRNDREAMEAAFASLSGDAMSELFADYHRGLALAAMGDLEAAEAALSRVLDGGAPTDGRPALALAAVRELAGQPREAREVYGRMLGSERGARLAHVELDRMDRGEPASLTVRSARSGAAEALFSIAGALGGDRNGSVAMIYARAAVALRPELNEASLLLGGLLDAQELHAEAAEVYAAVPRQSPLFLDAEVGRADALIRLERLDEAVAALRSAAEAEPGSLRVQLSLASALRRAERWEEAVEVYDEAIRLIDPVERRHWGVFYERGIAHERAGSWDQAEADFFRALELEPDQPLVLNYLGYSWVELRRHYDRAQEMIEKAVEQRPEDGYITDSLGWVLYRVGKYEEATVVLERAAELMPTDPVINDHLGDALWMVGRRLEARFHWRRAMSFDPEPEDAERIRRKLDVGLDAVLREERKAEAADPADAVARDDG